MSDKKAAFIYNNHLYFFSGNSYVIVALSPNQHIVRGPGNIDDWTAFKNTGFDHIDAIIPVADSQYAGEFYVFSGTNYVWMKLDGAHPTDPTKSIQATDVLAISSNWKSLAKAGFDSVDAALLNIQKSGQEIGTPQEAFFWKVYLCVNIKYTPKSDDDTALLGPLQSEGMWASFKSEQISGVDAVFGDADPMQFWVFFNSTEAIQVKYNGEPGTGNDWVELGRAPVINYFPPLKIFYQ